jgi:hypothetical protein
MSIPLDFNMSGFAYDVDNPTLQNEKLSYCLFQILDNLRAEGYTFRSYADGDVDAVEALLADMQADFSAQENGGDEVAWQAAPDEAVEDIALYAAFAAIRNRILTESSKRKTGQAGQLDLSELIACLQDDIKVAIEEVALQEGIVRIGSHDVWLKSQVVDEIL